MGTISTKSLTEKLGIRQNQQVAFVNAPKNYFKMLGRLPKGTEERQTSSLDVVQIFARDQKDFVDKLMVYRRKIKPGGAIWISWPKGGKAPVDINENIIRDIALQYQLVDVKVIAVDDVWSGPKLVVPLKFRN